MDIRQRLFAYRSYAPVPFLAVMVIFAHPAPLTLVIGGGIVCAGEFLRLWGVAIAGSETRTTGPVGGTFLITTGPFSYVRNPLYCGNMLLYVGAGIMSNALMPWLPIAAAAWFAFQYSMIVSLEEEYLQRTFQDEFTRYRAAVPRFVPTFRRYGGVPAGQPGLDWKRGLISERRTLQAIVLLAAGLAIISWARS
jgi:protein-S-isoprenylcysteine O-methyltransferase Ste14